MEQSVELVLFTPGAGCSKGGYLNLGLTQHSNETSKQLVHKFKKYFFRNLVSINGSFNFWSFKINKRQNDIINKDRTRKLISSDIQDRERTKYSTAIKQTYFPE